MVHGKRKRRSNRAAPFYILNNLKTAFMRRPLAASGLLADVGEDASVNVEYVPVDEVGSV